MERVLLYGRNADLPDLLTRFEGEHPDADVVPRNAAAHTEGQLEEADLVLVDDRYAHVAEEYSDAGHEVKVFSFQGRDPAAEVPSPGEVPDRFEDIFASTTAYEEAVDAGLEPPDFEAVEPAGKTGITTSQVREIAEEE